MKKLLLLTGLLVVALGIWVAAASVDTNATPEKKTEKAEAVADVNGLEVGDKAPGFKLKNVDGTMVSPEDEAYADAKG